MRLAPLPSGRLRKICELKPPPRATSYAIVSSTGDHRIEPTGSVPFVICFGCPPATSVVHTCGTPLRLLRKAMRRPSGEYTGLEVLGISAMALMWAASACDAGDCAPAAVVSDARHAIVRMCFILILPGKPMVAY